MADVAYGVWDGQLHDAQNGESPLATLKNFGEFDEGNPIRAFFGDRGSSSLTRM